MSYRLSIDLAIKLGFRPHLLPYIFRPLLLGGLFGTDARHNYRGWLGGWWHECGVWGRL